MKTSIAVNTLFGPTERYDVENIEQQGGLWGPIKCSNSIDSIGRKALLDSRLVYRYKEKVSVPHLSYIDDLLGINKCGIEALNSNIFLTLHIEMKRMNFNVGGPNKKSKCHRMHVGPKHNIIAFQALSNGKDCRNATVIDSWEVTQSEAQQPGT